MSILTHFSTGPTRKKVIITIDSFRDQQDLSSFPSTAYSDEEHIYEEIAEAESDTNDEDTTADSDTEDNSLFTLISSGRRNNLRYYGDTSWD